MSNLKLNQIIQNSKEKQPDIFMLIRIILLIILFMVSIIAGKSIGRFIFYFFN